jgi:hypothetical protein
MLVPLCLHFHQKFKLSMEQISSGMSFSKTSSSKSNIVIMTCLILNLGCECQTIVISLKNGVLLHQSSKQGIYQKAGKVNGKTSWILTSNNNALWYNPSDWMIGPVDYLGTSYGSIWSTGGQGISSCPYNIPNDDWMYSNDGSPFIADANDVSVECLTGN